MTDIPDTERAWAAGFFDGEGTAGCWNRGPQRISHYNVQARIGQTDRVVLDRFATIVGVGKIYGPYQTKRNAASKRDPKPVYFYSASGCSQVETLLEAIGPWLSPVKMAQLKGAVDTYRDSAPAMPQRRNKAAVAAYGGNA